MPQRVDSLHNKKGMSFTQIDEELRDIRRVHSQGQEEDLRMALSRTIGRVEELVRFLLFRSAISTNDHSTPMMRPDVHAERRVQSADRHAD